MYRPALALAAILIAASATARADDLSDAVAAIPGAIEQTRLVGSWTIDSDQGAYRLVVARAGEDFKLSRLFVQWLEMDDAAIKLRHNLEIGEVRETGISIVDYTAESDAEGLSVFVDAINPATQEPQTFELFVFGPDEYQFGPASN